MADFTRTESDLRHNVNINLNVRGLPQSATLAINELSKRLQAEGRTVYKLGLGQSPFPVPAEVVAALKENAHQKDYLPVGGLPALKEAVAERHRRRESIDYRHEDVLIGPGSKELMFLVQLVYYGDLVIPVPSWVSYAPQARIIGRHIHWLDTHHGNDLHLTPDVFERLCAQDPECPRLIILNYPNNPSGTTYSVDELKAIAAVARKYRVILISDEIYGDLHHQGKHVSIARFYPEGTIISSGLSKWCGAGGWRLGTFVFPRALHWLREAMAVVASETFTATSAPIQYAAVTAFRGSPAIDHYLVLSRRILKALGNHCARKLQRAGAVVPRPRGGFYLFANFNAFRTELRRRGIYTSQQFCDTLLEETGVAVLPGSAFGLHREELSTRLSYVDFDGAAALAAAEAIRPDQSLDTAFLKRHCAPVVTAIDRLVGWVGNL